MKRIISVICVCCLLLTAFAFGAVSASAATPAKTIVDVNSGDTVTYYLKLSGCKENVICADYSVYYDSSVLRVDAVADFNDSFNEEDVESVINTDNPNEISANFIKIGKGVSFSSERTFIAVKFTAIASGSTHISYYIRDMAGNSYFTDPDKPEISDYLFTCNVTVNSTKILENAQPELNTEEPQSIGDFVNSVNGKSEDADYVASAGGGSGNTGESGNTGNDTPGGSDDTEQPTSATQNGGSRADLPHGGESSADEPETKPAPTSGGEDPSVVTTIGGSESGSDAASESDHPFPWLWVVIGGLVLLGGGGVAAFLVMNKKNKGTNG